MVSRVFLWGVGMTQNDSYVVVVLTCLWHVHASAVASDASLFFSVF